MKVIKIVAGVIAVIISSAPLASWATTENAEDQSAAQSVQAENGLGQCVSNHDEETCETAQNNLRYFRSLPEASQMELILRMGGHRDPTRGIPMCIGNVTEE